MEMGFIFISIFVVSFLLGNLKKNKIIEEIKKNKDV